MSTTQNEMLALGGRRPRRSYKIGLVEGHKRGYTDGYNTGARKKASDLKKAYESGYAVATREAALTHAAEANHAAYILSELMAAQQALRETHAKLQGSWFKRWITKGWL